MLENFPIEWLYYALLFFGVVITLCLLLLGWIAWRVKHIHVPEGADFLTTLRYTPFSVVLLLDLLDLAFDFLSAPVVWVILTWLGLKGLRGVSVAESVIPGTQFLPTMTVAWIFARLRG